MNTSPSLMPPSSDAGGKSSPRIAVDEWDELTKAIDDKKYCWVAGPPGFGKSSTLQWIAEESGSNRVIFSLNLRSRELERLRSNPESWLREVSERLLQQADKDTSALPSDQGANVLRSAVELLLAAYPGKDVLLLLDDVDRAPGRLMDELRACHESRGQTDAGADYRRLTVIATACTAPVDKDRGLVATEQAKSRLTDHWTVVALPSFTRAGVADLAKIAPDSPAFGDPVLDLVFGWTLGHPSLSVELLAVASHAPNDAVRCERALDDHVRTVFAGAKETDDRPSCLRRLRAAISAVRKADADGLEMLRKHLHAIVFGQPLPEKKSGTLLGNLARLGAIRWPREGSKRAWPSSRIYEAVLAAEWYRVEHEDKPPFDSQLAAWRSEERRQTPMLSSAAEVEAVEWFEAHDRADGAYAFFVSAFGEARRRALRDRSAFVIIAAALSTGLALLGLAFWNGTVHATNVANAEKEKRREAEAALKAIQLQQEQRRDSLSAEAKKAADDATKKENEARDLEAKALRGRTESAEAMAANARKLADTATKRARDAEAAKLEAESAAKAAEDARREAAKHGSQESSARELMQKALTQCQGDLDHSRRAIGEAELKVAQCANERDRFKTTSDSCQALSAKTAPSGQAVQAQAAQPH